MPATRGGGSAPSCTGLFLAPQPGLLAACRARTHTHSHTDTHAHAHTYMHTFSRSLSRALLCLFSNLYFCLKIFSLLSSARLPALSWACRVHTAPLHHPSPPPRLLSSGFEGHLLSSPLASRATAVSSSWSLCHRLRCPEVVLAAEAAADLARGPRRVGNPELKRESLLLHPSLGLHSRWGGGSVPSPERQKRQYPDSRVSLRLRAGGEKSEQDTWHQEGTGVSPAPASQAGEL